jgi:hypothetical protein
MSESWVSLTPPKFAAILERGEYKKNLITFGALVIDVASETDDFDSINLEKLAEEFISMRVEREPKAPDASKFKANRRSIIEMNKTIDYDS